MIFIHTTYDANCSWTSKVKLWERIRIKWLKISAIFRQFSYYMTRFKYSIYKVCNLELALSIYLIALSIYLKNKACETMRVNLSFYAFSELSIRLFIWYNLIYFCVYSTHNTFAACFPLFLCWTTWLMSRGSMRTRAHSFHGTAYLFLRKLFASSGDPWNWKVAAYFSPILSSSDTPDAAIAIKLSIVFTGFRKQRAAKRSLSLFGAYFFYITVLKYCKLLQIFVSISFLQMPTSISSFISLQMQNPCSEKRFSHPA